jgi:DNA (cytosine-5)-methyltransferase 1
MDYSKMKCSELKALCKERNIKGYSTKDKEGLLELLNQDQVQPENTITENTVSGKLRMIDLFAGTGAFTHAFQQTGKVECVFANDMVESSKKAYDTNFGHSHKLTLGDLNDIAVESIPPHDILTGGFPCFVAGTKVLTDVGYKNIEDVSLSDKLLTHTGKFQKILNLQQKTQANNFNSIKVMYHPRIILSTNEHPFYVRERKRILNATSQSHTYVFEPPQWIEAQKITDNHYCGMPINTESIIPTINNILLDGLEHWFMIGYFLGNGRIEDSKKLDGSPKNAIRFNITNDDEGIIASRIKKILQITSNNTCIDDIWHFILKQFGKYIHNKTIPEWVQSLPPNLIQEFINGYTLANSSKDTQNNIIYTCISENIAFSIQRLYLKLGQVCSINYKKVLTINGRKYKRYVMTVNTNKDISNNFLIENNNYVWFKVKRNIAISGTPQTVYNFEVENDNSYCVENVIVHNCQPFSLAGRQEGFQDPRSNVFWKILEIIDHHTPKCVVLENVKNLVSHDDNKTFETIKKNLTDRGYYIKFKVLDTAKITGIPQHRERIYIVCMKSKEALDKFSLDFDPKPKAKIGTMLEKTQVPDKYYYTSASSTWPLVSEAVTKKETIYQYRRVYVRENKSDECPTLTANMGGGGHNVPLVLDDKGIRKLTPRECFNFQGFPQTYKLPTLADSNLYKLAGNAVSVPVVTLIANRLTGLL